MTDWTTRVEPSLTQQYGVNEIHTVCFEPPRWLVACAHRSKMSERAALMFPELSAANGPLKEVALDGPEGERNPIEHPELAYRRAQQRGIRDLAKRYRELRDREPAP